MTAGMAIGNETTWAWRTLTSLLEGSCGKRQQIVYKIRDLVDGGLGEPSNKDSAYRHILHGSSVSLTE